MVIPTYNRAELLRRQLEGLTRQRLAPERFEVVVADDGSCDHTAEVVASFSGKLRIGYHTQEDLGFRAAAVRNAGARLATAPLLVFLDTGALIGPDFLTAHLAAHQDPDPAQDRDQQDQDQDRDQQAQAQAQGPDPDRDQGPEGPTGGRLVLGYTYGYNPYQPFPGLADALAGSDPEDVVRRYSHQSEFRDLRHADLEKAGFDLGRLAAPWMNVWALNMSLPAADFHAVGGFHEDFRSWGGEDLEFGFRVHERGLPIVLSRQAWALESPHDRDLDGNRSSNCANSWLLWEKHPEPVMELYGAMYSRNHYDPPLEYEYQRLLEWRDRCHDSDVSGEVARLAAGPLPDGGRASRVVVMGAGGHRPPPADGVTYTLLDFDERLLAGIPAGNGTAVLHAIGLRTVLEAGCADLVVITSRLRGLWERWSADVLTEACRIGGSVRVAFTDSTGPL
ncbi:glycosyltransferase [Streptomyces sp. NPDC126933]|uniref:glycosyltransferase n=1 Tax=unclassified Streptomyces TaxID=2593676 RepID=UPI003664AD60